MCASGLAGVLTPGDVGAALELRPTTPRGRTEVRAGLGGTYAALGAWALADRSSAAKRAVGFTWLGAGLVRLGSLAVDRPRTDPAFWAYLAIELGLGSAAVREAGRGRSVAEVSRARQAA
jgi:Domain of unknown function (DUF4345)